VMDTNGSPVSGLQCARLLDCIALQSEVLSCHTCSSVTMQLQTILSLALLTVGATAQVKCNAVQNSCGKPGPVVKYCSSYLGIPVSTVSVTVPNTRYSSMTYRSWIHADLGLIGLSLKMLDLHSQRRREICPIDYMIAIYRLTLL
jgi:hypothetical protein